MSAGGVEILLWHHHITSETMTRQELEVLVKRATEAYSRRTGIAVLNEARQVLVDEAVPHLTAWTGEMNSGRLTESQLESAVQSILGNTSPYLAEQRVSAVGPSAVRYSMARDCPYMGWC